MVVILNVAVFERRVFNGKTCTFLNKSAQVKRMFTLQQILDATEDGLRKLYEKEPAERDPELGKRVLVLARLAYNSNESRGRAAYHLAMALFVLGRKNETPVYFEEAIINEKENAEYHCDYAVTLLNMGMPHAARSYIGKAKQIDPRNGDFDRFEGWIEETLNKYDLALRCYKRGKAKFELHENPEPGHIRSLRYVQDDIRRVEKKIRDISLQFERETNYWRNKTHMMLI